MVSRKPSAIRERHRAPAYLSRVGWRTSPTSASAAVLGTLHTPSVADTTFTCTHNAHRADKNASTVYTRVVTGMSSFSTSLELYS